MARSPSLEDLRRAADALGLGLDDQDLSSLHPLIAGLTAALDNLDAMAPPAPEVRYARRPGRRPPPEENPLGAWYWQSRVAGAPSGPLAGKQVVLKDNIALAGVPMMNGCAALTGYVPEFDATVATRILDAGGEIVGKAVCENLCLSAGSHTAATGPVRNPHDPTRTTGGSSSGCGALVAAGACDLAIGGDQGGSIRVPAALCGIYGLKPTFGLVPYTGAFPLDMSVDHLGPMGRSVRDVATLLEVIAGPDGSDPRQAGVEVRPYVAGLDEPVSGLRVGMLDEGFGHPGGDPEVDASVRGAAGVLAALGALVGPVSVPMHRDSGGITMGILSQGATSLMFQGGGTGTGWKGWYPTSMGDAFWRGWRASPRTLPPTAQMVALVGRYLSDTYGNHYYSTAQNLVPSLTAAYDRALSEVDVLVMPTTTTTAPPLPPEGASVVESLIASFASTANTPTFDVTGHPAMSVPCGWIEGLPVGMMLVGRRGEDDVVLRVARAFEESGAFVPRAT